jgi:Exostosin family
MNFSVWLKATLLAVNLGCLFSMWALIPPIVTYVDEFPMPVVKGREGLKTMKILGADPINDVDTHPVEWNEAINRTVLAFPIDLWPNNPTSTWPLRDLNLRVYLYDTSSWPEELRTVSSCRLKYYLNASLEPVPSNDNRIADVGLIRLFQTYPGRVYDPSEADIFVVPYPHASHCFSNCLRGSYQPSCGGVSQDLIDDLVDKQLTWFQGTTIERHLFLLSTSHMLNRKLQLAPLKFVIGPRVYKPGQTPYSYRRRMNPRRRNNPMQIGNFIIPYMNTHPRMQPSVIQSRTLDWSTRPRKYSFVYFCGGRNKRTTDDPRIHRRRFEWYMTNHSLTAVAGLPFVMEGISNTRSPEEIFEFYQDSVFCPCLPGDTVTQKRFFDAILNGCLPVVLRFPHGSNLTWHPFQNSLLQNALPFAHSAQFSTDLLVNYTDFVVEVDLPASNVVHAMTEWLQPERAQELKRRQEAMSRVAPFLTYGLGPEAHQSDDAFARLLRGLKHYVDVLPERLERNGTQEDAPTARN